jgi:hypothetical protein
VSAGVFHYVMARRSAVAGLVLVGVVAGVTTYVATRGRGRAHRLVEHTATTAGEPTLAAAVPEGAERLPAAPQSGAADG